jgi:hypothetical protein
MKIRSFLVVLAVVATSAQNKGTLEGFTKSASEHIINELEQPFQVQSISGLVTHDGVGQYPLKDVLVEIKGPGDHDTIRRTRTGGNGQFRIGHVPAGIYRFKVTLNGFQSVIGTIIVSKSAAKGSRIKIAMLIGV